MAEQAFNPDQFHAKLEAEIKDLEAEIRLHQERPEAVRLEGKDLVRKSLETYSAKNSAEAPPDDSSPLPEYAKDAPAGTRLEIEHLVDLVFHGKGIVAAASQAAKSSPFVLDAFHDALAGRLYPELQKRGIVK
ncbi:MAG: hypothetical protein KGI73_04825 [Patescibacteria group bacterium]|nr:hypothetical protein [Patescibacteria group bacterium]